MYDMHLSNKNNKDVWTRKSLATYQPFVSHSPNNIYGILHIRQHVCIAIFYSQFISAFSYSLVYNWLTAWHAYKPLSEMHQAKLAKITESCETPDFII